MPALKEMALYPLLKTYLDQAIGASVQSSPFILWHLEAIVLSMDSGQQNLKKTKCNNNKTHYVPPLSLDPENGLYPYTLVHEKPRGGYSWEGWQHCL